MPIELLTPILSAIGGAIGTLGVYSVFPKIITNRLSEIHQQKNRILLEEIKSENQILVADLQADYTFKLEEVKRDYQKDLEGYKTGLQTVARYSEYQFKLYNELWISLYELKSRADDLWEHASARNLTKFSNQIKVTKKNIEQNILLINKEHHQDLIRIIGAFEKFKVGKGNLISNRNRHREAEINNIGPNELEYINMNKWVKNEYIILVDMLAVDFKKHISESLYN